MSEKLEALLARRKIVRMRDILDTGAGLKAAQDAFAANVLVRSVLATDGELHGIFETPEAQDDPRHDEVLAMVLTGGVIFGQYAGMKHGLGTMLPERMDIYVGRGRHPPEKQAYRLTHTRDVANMSVGVEEIATDLGIPVRMTSRARTVVDLLRAKKRNSDDYRHGVEALVTFLDEGGTPSELMEMAGEFEAWVRDEVESSVNVHGEGYGRGKGL